MKSVAIQTQSDGERRTESTYRSNTQRHRHRNSRDKERREEATQTPDTTTSRRACGILQGGRPHATETSNPERALTKTRGDTCNNRTAK